MIDEQWRVAWNVYERACELPAGERRAFVESEVVDPALRQRIFSMLERPDGTEGSETEPELTAPDWPQLGKTIGRFVVTAPLGRGGMGDVYKARDQELHRTVAMKFVSSGSIGTAGVDRFMNEAQSASALNHPGIVTVHEVIHYESTLAIVMELIEGKSFRDLSGKPNAPEQIADWGRQMAEALAVAHAHHIVHRDIKPDNVMLRNDNRVKILDFGIARVITDQNALEAVPLGTLGYMAPEQIACREVTSAADIFSLGVILFELATGKHPFLASTASETTQAIALLDPGPVRISHASRVGQRDLDALIRSMLAKEPGRRPSAAAVAVKLDQIARGLQAGKRQLVLSIAISALAASAIGAVAWWSSRRQVDVPPTPPRITQFTTLQGREIQPSFSPDGRKVAFVWDGPEGLNRDIYIQDVDGDTPIRLTSDPAEDTNPVWSPDGKEIAFLRRIGTDGRWAVLIMTADGKRERTVGKIIELEFFHGVLAWWPDGKSLIVRDVSLGTVGFVRLIPESGEKLPLTTPTGNTDRDSDVAVSPDERRFAFLRRLGGTMRDQICIQELAGKGQNCYTIPAHPGNLVWWRNGKELLYTTPDAIWRVAADQTMSEKRYKVREGAIEDLAADHTGHRLVASRGNIDLNLWRVDRRGKSRVKLIASTKEESDAQYSPDGEHIVFRSDRSGTLELWVSNKDGSNQTRITKFSGRLGSARWSPDGKYIAFDAYASPVLRSANTNVYVMPASGGPARRLTDDKALYFVPNWSHDGRWVYCVKQIGTRWETWKAPFEGGPLVQVSSTGMFDLAESADGKDLYYTTQRGAPGIWHRPIEGGQGTLVPGTEKVGTYRYWQLTPTGIYFAEGPADPVVQFVNLKTGARTRLASLGSHFRKGPRGLTVSPDGLSFLYAQEDDRQSDLYLIDGIP